MTEKIQIGFDMERYFVPIFINLLTTGHFCIVGSTGSGKSLFVLYVLYGLLNIQSGFRLYIGDFKKSGDYTGVTAPERFAEFDYVVMLIESFYADFENTPEGNLEIKVLLLDEYAGFITWLTQNDKKRCEEIKSKITTILMLGRSRHCFVWCVQQRMTAQLFPAGIGAVDNFQLCVGLGRLSTESRKSLFAGERLENTQFEETFSPGIGEGLCLIDGQPLKAIKVPRISDKEKLKKLLRLKR
jgi:hypothetical protein